MRKPVPRFFGGMPKLGPSAGASRFFGPRATAAPGGGGGTQALTVDGQELTVDGQTLTVT